MRGASRAAAIALGLVLIGVGAMAQGAECTPWPGEPAPLPSRGDPDPARARWAELRATELAQRARQIEASAPLEAHRLWRRLLCLRAGSETARQGLERTRPVRIHRLSVIEAPPAAAPQSAADPWAGLAAPLRVAEVRPLRPVPEPTPERTDEPARAAERARLLAHIDRLIDRSEERVRRARFDGALASTLEARSRLEEMRWESDLVGRWVRLEVVEATVQVALGRAEQARACAARAIARDPELALDPKQTSPKVIRVFEAARVEQERAR